VTQRTIYRLAGAKKIPAFKVGGTRRSSRADIEEWIRHPEWTLGGDQSDDTTGKPG
jgi:excisionase family DNA binding protein